MHAWMYGWTCMNFYLLFYVILLREFKFILSVPKYGMVIGSCSSSHPSIIDMYACTCVYNSIYMWIFMYVCIVARVVYTFGSLHPIPFQQVGYLYCLIVDHLTTRTIFMKDAILYLFLRREKTIFSKTKGAPLDA